MLDKVLGKMLLIDGDIIRHRCAFAAEKTKYLVQGPASRFMDCDSKAEANEFAGEDGIIWSRKDVQPVEKAYEIVDCTMGSILSSCKPSGYRLFLSGDSNFRYQIAKTKVYKGNRSQPKPVHFLALGEYLVRSYSAEYTDGVEADDALGIGLSAEPERRVIVSNDKDLDQVPGWHYNWVTGESYWVSPREGDFALYTQILRGDTTDNVPGLPGIGPAGALEILEGSKSSKELCQRTWIEYRDYFGDTERARDYFMEQARLLYILRKEGDSYQSPIPLE